MAVENLITEHIDIWTSAVKTKSASGRGSNKKLELYGVKKLRELILELAVRGKLVPQDPNDEPASVLLKRIAQEKAQLVKEKKLKKPKKLPNISDEEKPFDLPNGWSWIRLNEYGEWGSGSTPKRSNSEYYDGGIPWFKSGELKADYISESEETITELALSETSVRYNNVGDVLVAMYGATIGKTAILSVRATTNQAVCACTPFTGLSNTYLLTLLKAYKARLIGMGAGGAQPNISREKIITTVIALPSTAEQRRIVAKVDELMALCDQLEQQTEDSIEAHQVLVTTLLDTLTNSADADELMQNWARISEHFDTLFTTEASIDQLKQTILQLAVMGKLVPQDPTDEPASELLKRIAEEKAQLVKEKKIKKEKTLPPIAEDEKPFELPSGWEWCRLEDVVDIQSGITKGRKLAGRELKTIPYLSVANVQRGYLILNNVKEIDLPIDELEKYSVEDGDLLITEGGDWDKVGRTAIWRSEVPYMAHQNHVFKARPFLKEQSEAWLEMYLNGPFARKYFAGSSKQTTNLASINKTQLRSCLIAVPPRDEKKEISDRVQELIGMCDLLLEGIRASLQTQLQLTDVIVDQVV
ncbi:restriction endonuclease subunit S [Vibrio cholerae]|uniref:restriction endonuclease subunit S n=1 Tax=Vibrio cholerae TaxID=666 RepID=UPI0001563C24|nr:restriction endonuclease subunit S [Vibrio cholerae]EJL6534314.1 restriction endonuclease subunit S [Vibrio cholerae]KNA45718.1 type I restriction modification DNA specificity domain-containing protein [Vibrio cholerae MZO-2]OEC18534.1 restriction endonuclease subunit S [Vibrio cholerae]HDL9501936.1 restriction endonuclease subunit S [Vibrio cholerae]HDV5444807.1 restriction endonuclease subunit S [Vibrio cholerae]